jgi:hypothetical protein
MCQLTQDEFDVQLSTDPKCTYMVSLIDVGAIPEQVWNCLMCMGHVWH